MPLENYRQKRDFERTPEPAGKVRKGTGGRLYIVQRHAARNLHDDLRLELGGVLLSWAVPKGVNAPAGEKRLAVHVEDHPLEYGAFEGVIPEGSYGAGTVMLWDRGEWEPLGDPRRAYRRGKLSFRLHGEKLRGTWTLVRMRGDDEQEKNWLLVRQNEPESIVQLTPQQITRSCLSGRTMGQITAARDRLWTADGESTPELPSAAELPGARPGLPPAKPLPQLATLVAQVPAGDDWLHELKYDGYRLFCRLHDDQVQLLTRNGHDWSERFPELLAAAATLPQGSLFDGELVMLRADGTSDFQALQNWFRHGQAGGTLGYYLFDILFCQGQDLTRVPLLQRKDYLRALLAACGAGEPLRYGDHIRGQGTRMLAQICRFGLEGIISKRYDSRYQQGRSRSWRKIKCLRRQEFVIGGYSEPTGARDAFGALLLGYYDEDGQLIYAGRVGTGFSDRTLAELGSELQGRRQETPPFAQPPKGREARGVHWLRPELVAEVEFIEWTGDGRLRHPSFKGLREDRSAAEVRMEKVETGSKSVGGSEAAVAGVPLSNPERVLFPEQGATKLTLARFYENIAEHILPHIVDRPLTLVRCPQGRGKKCFYQKHFNETLPEHIGAVAIPEAAGGESLYLRIADLPGLIALVQLGVLEIHPWGSRAERLEFPDQVIFDLDPAEDVPWPRVLSAAGHLRDFLDWLELEAYVKTSGGKGLHVVAPLNSRAGWQEVKDFARAVAEAMAKAAPEEFVAVMSKKRRQGRIFIDYLRNGRGATSVAAYSTRARPGAPVSTPLSWQELQAIPAPDYFTIDNLPDRLAALPADPWTDFFSRRQSISDAARRKLRL
jgi:bifunctional non-homologous end joining protein LigD